MQYVFALVLRPNFNQRRRADALLPPLRAYCGCRQNHEICTMYVQRWAVQYQRSKGISARRKCPWGAAAPKLTVPSQPGPIRTSVLQPRSRHARRKSSWGASMAYAMRLKFDGCSNARPTEVPLGEGGERKFGCTAGFFVVTSFVSFVFASGRKAQSLRCSSSPQRTRLCWASLGPLLGEGPVIAPEGSPLGGFFPLFLSTQK